MSRGRAGKSASGYALRGFPRATEEVLIASQEDNHNDWRCPTPCEYAKLIHRSPYDRQLKPLGKIQRATLGIIKRAPTACRHEHAASSLRASHPPERTIERVQLRFLG